MYRRKITFRRKIRRRPTYRKKTLYSRITTRRVSTYTPARLSLKRVFWISSWTPNTASTAGFWLPFYIALNQVPNYTEFTSLFDFYKISALKFTFYPKYTGYDGANTTDTTLPGITNQGQARVHVCYDNRTTVVPSGLYTSATFNTFLEQGRIKTFTNSNRPISVYMKTSILGQYINGTATNMYTAAKWLPTTNISSNHYGPNVFISDNNFTGTFGQTYDIMVTAYIQCKNIK